MALVEASSAHLNMLVYAAPLQEPLLGEEVETVRWKCL
jgi:hypothetical protein